jgi:hypothetical protein
MSILPAVFPRPRTHDVVATVTIRFADGTELVNYPILMEDVTTTNGAYRAVRDEANELVTNVIRGMLQAHRAGDTITAATVAAIATNDEI